MVLVHVESLVLRGASVVVDGLAVSLRLGSYETKPQTTKATPFSQRHPSHGCATAMPQTNGRHFPKAIGNSAVVRAGRLSRAGVLSRRSPALGGPQFTAAARLCPARAKQPAPVGDVFSGRPSGRHDLALTRLWCDERGRRATRTLTAASTRGRGF
jgi:hypothetical protein